MGNIFRRCQKLQRQDSFFDQEQPYKKYSETNHIIQLRRKTVKPDHICRLNCVVHNKVNQTDIDYFVDNLQWIHQQKQCYIDEQKLIFHYPDYKQDQITLEQNWNQIPNEKFTLNQDQTVCQSSALLLDIRRGIPIKMYRNFILFLFGVISEPNNPKLIINLQQVESNYQLLLTQIFQNNYGIPNNFKKAPLFCEEEELEKALPLHFLNGEGVNVMKRLLWVLNYSTKLDYCPQLVPAISILLLFLNEAETYHIIKQMINNSQQVLEGITVQSIGKILNNKWYFNMDAENFEIFCKNFFSNIDEKNNNYTLIINHFNKNKIEQNQLFESWIKQLFYQNLSFPLVLKLFATFLNEGIIIYNKISYGLCYVMKKEILENTESITILQVMKDTGQSFNFETQQRMLTKSFELNVKQKKGQLEKSKLNYSSSSAIKKSKQQFLAQFLDNSSILKDHQYESVWEMIPAFNKLKKAKMIWSTNSNGTSLSQLYHKCAEYLETSLLIIIESKNGKVFGAYSHEMVQLKRPGEEWSGNGDAFLFSLKPKEQQFKSQTDQNKRVYSTLEYLAFGHEGYFGLAIDSDLQYGHSYQCPTFNNEPLHGDYQKSMFEIKILEAFVFI